MQRMLDLLPAGSHHDPSGRLVIGGCAVSDLVAETGTPVLLGAEDALRDAGRSYLEAFRSRHPRTDVYFASKALPCPAVAGLFAQVGLGCDVASAGELAFALAGGVSAERMLLHGNAKTDRDLTAALEAGVGLVVIDSLDDVTRLRTLATRSQRVLIRVNPGIAAPTHEAMATGHDGSKFGVPAGELADVVRRVRQNERLTLEGLHVHIGSQILELDAFERAAEGIAQLREIAELGPEATYDLGGGLGVRYTAADGPAPSPDAYARALVDVVHAQLGDGVRLIVEPGRSLVASAIVTVYRVVTVKRGGPRTFVALDGGMGDNLEPMLYDTRFAPFVLDAGSDREAEVCDLVGPHCETGDRLAAEVTLPHPEIGDLVVVPVTGAYCQSLANNYNGMCRPPIVLCREGSARTVTRRETIEDLLARHVVSPARH